MPRAYNVLEDVLNEIENRIRENINEENLAVKHSISAGYLRRLFIFAFGQPIGTYIRSRKLATSIDDLLHTNLNILDIALDYGFEHEQSYIRAFKREFGVSPRCLCKVGHIAKITPPLHLFDSNKFDDDGLFFGPEIVMIPQFFAVGKKHKIRCRDERVLAVDCIKEFNDMKPHIPNIKHPHVLINISTEAEEDADYWNFMPSVQVKSLDNIPEEYDCYTFPSTLCARFRFVFHNHSFSDNMSAADRMFRAINDFMDDKNQNFFLERKKINIDRFDFEETKDTFCYWEWFAPVRLKTKDDVPAHSPGIIETYQQEIPALRFIGKKFMEPDCSYKEMLSNLDNCCFYNQFQAIEQQSDIDLSTLYNGGNAYICLVKHKGGKLHEYYLGLFMPEGTAVPEGYEAVDFPPSTLDVYRVYGKRDSVINYEAECRKLNKHEGWFFLRFNWRYFFKEDRYGKRILEYCYYITPPPP